MATKEELLQVHTSKHIADVQAYTSQGKDDVCRIYEQWRTYTCDYTYSSAAYSAGCSINIVDAICADEVRYNMHPEALNYIKNPLNSKDINEKN